MFLENWVHERKNHLCPYNTPENPHLTAICVPWEQEADCKLYTWSVSFRAGILRFTFVFASFFKCLKWGAERRDAVASVVCISSVWLLRALPVENLSKLLRFRKPLVMSQALFLLLLASPKNIDCVFVSVGSRHAPTSSSLWRHDVQQTVKDQRRSYSDGYRDVVVIETGRMCSISWIFNIFIMRMIWKKMWCFKICKLQEPEEGFLLSTEDLWLLDKFTITSVQCHSHAFI